TESKRTQNVYQVEAPRYYLQSLRVLKITMNSHHEHSPTHISIVTIPSDILHLPRYLHHPPFSPIREENRSL
ncbi:hypothetical protein PISMIDRAFT_680221, partial [Pisolithus microcarpus 441]